jgi:putative hydrolase of the HAD superfamily
LTAVQNSPARFVIFDLDGVLYDFCREERLAAFSKLSGRDAASLDAAIWGGDLERNAENGRYVTGADYLDALSHALGRHVSRAEWVDIRRRAMTPNHEVLEIARRLRGTVRIAMLSNNSALLREELPTLAPAAYEIFGASAHVSADFLARKPEEAVFRRICERYGFSVYDALFIDDDPAFVEGARHAGLSAHRFTGAESLRSALTAAGL